MSQKLNFVFERKNYLFLFAGLVLLIIGYILMSGGGTSDPSQFDGEKLFSTRRITIAPIIVLIGYAVIGYAIMLKVPTADPVANNMAVQQKSNRTARKKK